MQGGVIEEINRKIERFPHLELQKHKASEVLDADKIHTSKTVRKPPKSKKPPSCGVRNTNEVSRFLDQCEGSEQVTLYTAPNGELRAIRLKYTGEKAPQHLTLSLHNSDKASFPVLSQGCSFLDGTIMVYPRALPEDSGIEYEQEFRMPLSRVTEALQARFDCSVKQTHLGSPMYFDEMVDRELGEGTLMKPIWVVRQQQQLRDATEAMMRG